MPVLRHLRVAALLSALLVVPWLHPGDARATVDTSAVTQIKPDMTKDQVRAALARNRTLEQAVDEIPPPSGTPWLLAADNHARNVTASFTELEWE